MKNLKHTPAPWKIFIKAGTMDACRIKDAQKMLIADCFWMGENKTKETFTVEPYSLRESNEKDLVLYGINHLTREIRGLLMSRLLKVTLLETHFIPSFQIDFLPPCQ